MTLGIVLDGNQLQRRITLLHNFTSNNLRVHLIVAKIENLRALREETPH